MLWPVEGGHPGGNSQGVGDSGQELGEASAVKFHPRKNTELTWRGRGSLGGEEPHFEGEPDHHRHFQERKGGSTTLLQTPTGVAIQQVTEWL